MVGDLVRLVELPINLNAADRWRDYLGKTAVIIEEEGTLCKVKFLADSRTTGTWYKKRFEPTNTQRRSTLYYLYQGNNGIVVNQTKHESLEEVAEAMSVAVQNPEIDEIWTEHELGDLWAYEEEELSELVTELLTAA